MNTQNSLFEKLKLKIIEHKSLVLICVAIFCVIILILVVGSNIYNHYINNKLKSFKILSESPKNGQNNVSAGEIIISFTTDNPVLSSKQFNMTISPPIPFYWKIKNKYPTNEVEAQVYGGLKNNTTYTVKVTNNMGKTLAVWSFETTSQKPISSPLYIYNQGQKIIHDQFPLLPYLPYSNNDFYIDYTGPDDNTLEVDIETPDLSQDQVKQEVSDWIKSHGVDPATQKINYVNDF